MFRQLSLFPDNQSGEISEQPEIVQQPAITNLTARSSLAEACREFDTAMVLKGFTENTIKAFQADLRILAGFISSSRPIGQISTKDLTDFLVYLRTERGRPCNPKSYARRVTTLKVFFEWLKEIGARDTDPAAPLVHQPVHTPLPRVLSDEQVEQLLAAAHSLAGGKEADPRPLLLVELLLQTGIKKSECMNIHLSHLDVSNPNEPLLHVRYPRVQQAYKERTIQLRPRIVPILKAYRAKYQPAEFLFECTARNLEYVLRDLAESAGIEGGVSFESLRWTAALRDYRAGMGEELLRRKLGLSKLRWRETLDKLERLAKPAL